MTSRIRIEWASLLAIEPDLREIAAHATELATGYNEPANARLMGHEQLISAAEVVDSYEQAIEGGMRAFLLFREGELAGDADLRGIRDGTAEFAFMIGAPAAQGKGLGTRFAIMVHAFGFTTLGLHHIYASIVPHNVASRRVFDKLGYVVDDSPAARAYADDPDDLVLALARETFANKYRAELDSIRITRR
jgi:RimJ/RimL family protein N-acetyltransferase